MVASEIIRDGLLHIRHSRGRTRHLRLVERVDRFESWMDPPDRDDAPHATTYR
jgi:hypothetical protein